MKKVVLKLDIEDYEVKRMVSGLNGVESVTVDTKDKKLTATRDIDRMLAELGKLYHTKIVTVGPAKELEKKKDEPKKEEPKKADDEKKKDEKVLRKWDINNYKDEQMAVAMVPPCNGVESVTVDTKDKKLTATRDKYRILAELGKLYHTKIVTVGPAKELEKKKDEPKKEEPKKANDEKKKDELMLSGLWEIVHGLYPSTINHNHNHVERVDAALPRPLYNDLYIHMSSPQPKALPVGLEIVLLDSSEQKPSVDFYATNNRAYQRDILVSNSMREESRRQCMPECVLSLVDSTARISSVDFDAPDNSAYLVSAYQSGPIVLNSEKKDTGEGLNTECLTYLDDSSKQKSLSDVAATESKSHLVRAYQSDPVVSLVDNKNRGEALKRESIPKSIILRSEDLQQHSGGRRDDAAKSFCADYDPGGHKKDSLALISLPVLETLLIQEQPNDCVPLLPLGRLTHEDCVEREKAPDLSGVAQINGVEQRVNKLPRYFGGLTAQSASSSRWPIGLPDGGHILLHDPLDQSAILIEHAARADQCPPTLFLGEKKMVGKTLHRKCRTIRVLFAGNCRHFARGCEDAAKSLGVRHIFRKHGMKRIKQHGIHQWPFRQKWATRKGGLQQHFGCKHKRAVKSLGVSRSMFKSTCRQHWAYWWPGLFENNDSLSWKSFKVLPLRGQSNSIRNLAWQRTLTHKHCVRLKKSRRDYSGGSAAQSDIGLPDGGHILSLSKKKIVRTLWRKCRTMSVLSVDDHQQHVGRRWEDAVKFLGVKRICKQLVIHRETTAKRIRRQLGTHRWSFKQSAIRSPGGHIQSPSEEKIVRKTLKRKCSVLSLEDHKQHVDRSLEDAAKSHGAKRICRELVLHRLSTAKRICKQRGIHQWPFQRSAIGLPDRGHILPCSEKKIVTKTLKRKCKSTSVHSLVDRQHVDRRWEDAAKSHAMKHNCGQLVIHRVSRATRICRQHEIYRRWPFEQDWATMKGCSLGDKRPIRISTHVKLGSRLQLIYISWLGRFSPRSSALAAGGEIGGPIVSSCSRSAATNNIARGFGRDQSGSPASDSENERTREQEDFKEIYTNVTKDDLLRLYGRMNRQEAADFFGVSVATFKRICRKNGINQWPHVRKQNVGRPPDRQGKGKKKAGRPPDQHGEGNTSTEFETPSHNVQRGLEGELVYQIQEAYVFRQDFTEGPTAFNTENLIIGGSSIWEIQGRDLFASQVPAPEEEPLSEEHAFGSGISPLLECDPMEYWIESPWSDPAPSQTMPAIQHTTDPALSQTMPAIHHTTDPTPSQTMPAIRHTTDPAPSQTMPAIQHTMDLAPRPHDQLEGQTRQSTSHDQLEGQTRQSTSHPNPNVVVPPEPQIPSTQKLSENMESSENWEEFINLDFSSLVELKVSYGNIKIRFWVPLTSTLDKLKEEVKNRLKLEPSSFDFYYIDEENDRILLSWDMDLKNHLQRFSNQLIKLLVVVDSDASTKKHM